MSLSRRAFLAATGTAGSAIFCGDVARAFASDASRPSKRRTFQVSISPDGLDMEPGLLDLYRSVGVSDVWVTGFLYGYWHYPIETMEKWRREAEKRGIAAHVINVPLGHPGDSLIAPKGGVPLTPPPYWSTAVLPNGAKYCGTSLHPPATEENVAAMKRLAATSVKKIFLDDDFRLARSPGMIGGCFCKEHKAQFLKRGGYPESAWKELLDDVNGRRLTPVLRAWTEFLCDQLTACFRAQQAAAPAIQLGPMIMYMGAEKAGIRLADYRDTIVRIGECHFSDGDFGTVKGKCDELFSVLFHRRFFAPERSYSETTAFPAAALSAKNLAAKLVISTIADVRHTMFMSGLTPFPRDRWDTLAPAIKRESAFHDQLAGHAPRGPLKHYWGERGRLISDDNPYSLFLAMGVPFEVTETPAADGFTFLGDFDAAAVQPKEAKSSNATFIVRSGSAQAATPATGFRIVPESLPELFKLKREIVSKLDNTPYVEQDAPVVCAWYPTARCVLLWNLSDRREELTVRCGDQRRNVSVGGLESAIVEGIAPGNA
jgi:hypothetical protein